MKGGGDDVAKKLDGAKKPVFLSKAQREQLALQRCQEEVAQQTHKAKLFLQSNNESKPISSSDRDRDLDRWSSHNQDRVLCRVFFSRKRSKARMKRQCLQFDVVSAFNEADGEMTLEEPRFDGVRESGTLATICRNEWLKSLPLLSAKCKGRATLYRRFR
ncbi:unnamed protein product [Fraxinus pennsylvanica]|uniref:Uncharacterized protein n=1 Tax=Fraxinus pennsylvanica TaxID=56036 RepID=A0AAD2DWD6_9LAMI|nr:unnamed protein product [Fraxinus pennsylvanica]